MRIELFCGQGDEQALIDLRSARVYFFGHDMPVQEWGGEIYYHSRSGLSCAGWVPAHPWLLRPTMIRMDVSVPMVCGDSPAAPQAATFRSVRMMLTGSESPEVYVPYVYGRVYDREMPETITITGEEVVLGPPMWRGDETRQVTLDYYLPNGGFEAGLGEVQVSIPVRGGTDYQARIALLALYGERMKPEENEVPGTVSDWWTRLGLYDPGALAEWDVWWKLDRRGIIRGWLGNPFEGGREPTVEELQDAYAPPGVWFLRPDVYVAGTPERAELYVRHVHATGEDCGRLVLTTDQAMRIWSDLDLLDELIEIARPHESPEVAA